MTRLMKDSGIEWIGEMPETWTLRRLRFLCDISTGNQDTQDNDPDGEYPFYVRSPIVERSRRYTFEGPAILMAGDGVGAGKVFHYVDGKYGCHQRVYSMQHIRDIYRKFLFYYLQNRFVISIETANSKSTVDSVRLPMLQDFPVAMPSLSEQRRIADFLDRRCAEIDAVIERTKATIEEYKKLKQAVITEAVTKGVRGARKMKDSGIEWIGEIAEAHPLIKLKHVCQILDQYRSPVTADQRSQSGEVLFDYYGASGAIDKIDSYTIDDHVMLIGEDGANLRLRNLPLMYEVNGKAWINNHAHILKPNAGTDFYYLFYALEALDINPYITGSAQPKLSQENLRNILIPMPCLDEQREIAAYIREKSVALDTLIAKKNALLTELETYKKSLIYEYVTGKKEV